MSATAAAPLLSAWRAAPSPPPHPACSSPLGPSGFGQIDNGSAAPPGIIATLTTYFDAIDTGDFATAYAQLSPSEQATMSEAQFAASHATSFDYDIVLGTATTTTTGAELVDVSFTSLQSPSASPSGDQCDNWTLEYTMVNSGGSWLIQLASGQDGVTHNSC